MGNYRKCQSCGTSIEQYGTNTDGNENLDYCKYCYLNGEFTSTLTLEEMIEHVVQMKKQLGASQTELADTRSKYHKSLAALKRWEKS